MYHMELPDDDLIWYSRELSNVTFIFLLLYVDDMLMATKSMVKINKLDAQLAEEFEMKDFKCNK